MEQKIGYKVLKKSRCSAVRSTCVGGRYYPRLKEVKPKNGCGPLCVFISDVEAKRFAHLEDSGHLIIVKCEYKESSYTSIWYNFSFSSKVELKYLPVETILADSVNCLE